MQLTVQWKQNGKQQICRKEILRHRKNMNKRKYYKQGIWKMTRNGYWGCKNDGTGRKTLFNKPQMPQWGMVSGSAWSSLLCFWTTQMSTVGKCASEKGWNVSKCSPLFYTKGISNPVDGEHCHTFCHKQHTWRSQASCPPAIGEA